MSEEKIVIVVDDPAISKNLETRLVNSGYSVSRLPNDSVKAFPFIEDTYPSLAVISVNLESEYSGLELAKNIKNKFGIPIIIICSANNPEAYNKAKKINPVAILHTPSK